jgi:hypothetical protein
MLLNQVAHQACSTAPLLSFFTFLAPLVNFRLDIRFIEYLTANTFTAVKLDTIASMELPKLPSELFTSREKQPKPSNPALRDIKAKETLLVHRGAGISGVLLRRNLQIIDVCSNILTSLPQLGESKTKYRRTSPWGRPRNPDGPRG